MSGSDDLKNLEKKVRSLTKKLERSEYNRAFLEQNWDRNSKLFQTLNTEIESQSILIKKQHEELGKEREKSEKLLNNILPQSIAERLKKNPSVIADYFNSITVLFTDIVGFTKISERLTPSELIDFLNCIFSTFDDLVEKYQLEKIKTIGDEYMVAAGFPEPRTDHAEAIADLALEMQEALVNIDKKNNKILMRTGIHTGPAVAGVIGTKKFNYDVWGDTVNTASRMESNGIGGKIQVSHAVYELLKNKYLLEPRGIIQVKGKGKLKTYWLKGKKH